MHEKAKNFVPSEKAKTASNLFIKLITTGKIKKEVLLNTSEEFNVNRVSSSIDNVSNDPNYLAIANK